MIHLLRSGDEWCIRHRLRWRLHWSCLEPGFAGKLALARREQDGGKTIITGGHGIGANVRVSLHGRARNWIDVKSTTVPLADEEATRETTSGKAQVAGMVGQSDWSAVIDGWCERPWLLGTLELCDP